MEKDKVDEYIDLVLEVSEIDPIAANYMIEEAPKLPSFKFDSDLMRCFNWNDAAYGSKYWANLCSTFLEVHDTWR